MRISIVITGLARGGAETQAKNLIIRLAQRGWTIEVISLLPPLAYVEELAAAGVPVHCLGMRRGVPDPRAIVRLARHLRRFRPDLVHAHMVHANLLARVTRLIAPVPVLISTAHSVVEGGRLRMLGYRFTDPLCELTTHVCSAGMRRSIALGAVPPHKIIVIPNAVDSQLFRPDPALRAQMRRELGLEHAFVWLAVGRFETPKDYPTMLRAFAQLSRQWQEAVLVIAGDGSLRPQIETLIHQLSLERRVRLLGVRTDIPALMNVADAYVMSSLWEGMPNVLLEASASALPIVATRVGGIPEIIQEGVTGLLTEPANPEQLAAMMEQLMRFSDSQRRAMGQAGREFVERNHTFEEVLSRWEQLYQEMAHGRQSPRMFASSRLPLR